MNNFKSIITSVLVMLVFVGSAFATEGDKKTPKVTASEKVGYSIYAVQNTMKFRFAFNNQSDDKVKVSIFNEAGKKVRTDVYTKNTGKIGYDLSAIGEGVYTVKIQAGDFVTERKIGVGVKSSNAAFAAYVSPALKNGSATLACENGTKGIYINLTDADGTILYSEHTSNNSIARKLNMTKLAAGTYNLQLTSGDKTVERIYVVK